MSTSWYGAFIYVALRQTVCRYGCRHITHALAHLRVHMHYRHLHILLLGQLQDELVGHKKRGNQTYHEERSSRN